MLAGFLEEVARSDGATIFVTAGASPAVAGAANATPVFGFGFTGAISLGHQLRAKGFSASQGITKIPVVTLAGPGMSSTQDSATTFFAADPVIALVTRAIFTSAARCTVKPVAAAFANASVGIGT